MSSDSTLKRICLTFVSFFTNSALRRAVMVSLTPLCIPIVAALWLSVLILRQPSPEWTPPSPELGEKLEQRLIFAFSPLIGWVNAMEKAGPPEGLAWNAGAQNVLKQSPELLEVAWLVSEQGSTKALRKESRNGEDSPALEQMDSEIFQYVKKGHRPLGFAYKTKGESFFEFQIPLQTQNLFYGILVARYSLTQLLTTLAPDLPAGIGLSLWNGDEQLARKNSLSQGTESFWLPLDAWGKKLTIELQSEKTKGGYPLSHFLGIQWLGFLSLLGTYCLCLAWRSHFPTPQAEERPGDPAPLEPLSTDWFASFINPSQTPVAGKAEPPPQESEPLPVWAIAQQELIKEKLDKK